MVIIGADGIHGGNVYAFERATGELRWNFDAGGGVTSDMVRAGRFVLGVSLDDELLCLDLAKGLLQWRFSSGWKKTEPDREILLGSTPAVAGEDVYFGGRDGVVYALDVRTGKPKWQKKIGERITTSVAVVGDDLIIGVQDGQLVRLRRRDGSVQAKLPTPGEPYGPLLGHTQGLALFADWNRPASKVISVDRDLKRIAWEARPPEGRKWITARLFRTGDRVLVGTDGGAIYALKPADGTSVKLDTIRGDVRIFSQAEGMLFVGTIQGMLYALPAP